MSQKIIAVEEHLITPAMQAAWSDLAPEAEHDSPPRVGAGEIADRLAEAGEQRITWMDQAGIDVQVLSVAPPGTQNLSPDHAAALQVEINDALAATVGAHPNRFQGFATLATPSPQHAAAELERAIRELNFNGAMLYGRTAERNLDAQENWVIFEAAESLRAPLYIHPQIPQPGVREAIYSGFGDEIDAAFATAGIGWHYESGIQFLRLCLAGVFDRFPDLQVILGHWGEVILFYLDRLDDFAARANLPHSFSEYVARNAYITPGGIYSHRYLRWTLDVIAPERLLFAADYPYRPTPPEGLQAWLDGADLSPETLSDFTSGNWERLVAGIRR